MSELTGFNTTSLLEIFVQDGKEQMAARLDGLVRLMGKERFRQEAARQLVLLIRPEKALPRNMVGYALLVRDGLEFFFSHLSYQRLRRMLLGLAGHLAAADSGERLFRLALFCPTLHKIGQVIARNSQLDPGIKKWLVALEQGDYGTDAKGQIATILEQLAELEVPVEAIDISLQPIAEASVATVLAFCCREQDGGPAKGVFKVLKPGIRDDMEEELQVLADTFAFLDQNKQSYGLRQLNLGWLFREIQGDMAREVDLSAEQSRLNEAARVYGPVKGVHIPLPAPFNTPIMTSMEFIDGKKIDEIDFSPQQGLQLARLLFEAVVCLPLFTRQEQALFHGDPHAGNILITPGSDGQSLEVALLDWTLAGHLSKQLRIKLMELLLGLVKNDSRTIARVILSLSVPKKGDPNRENLIASIEARLTSKTYHACDFLKKAFLLLEAMTFEGLVFPAELILFRKAFFTLEGVLGDISSDFTMGEAMERYLAGLLVQELPRRYVNSIIAAADSPEQYQTLLSNGALQELAFYQTLGPWRQMMQMMMQQNSTFWAHQIRLLTDLCGSFSCSRFWSA